MTMVRAFRADPLLALLTAVLALAAWTPLYVTPFLPLQDLPDHVGMASLMWDALRGHGLAGRHYEVQFIPVPYWTIYVILAAVRAAIGPAWAAKLLVGLVILLVPLGVMRLRLALRRDPRLGLWAFALVWDHNLFWGWVAYLLGLALSFFVLARLVEAKTPKQALRAWPWTILVALTHAQAFGTLLLAGIALVVARRSWREGLFVHATGLAAGIVMLTPWIVMRTIARGGTSSSASPGLEWHPLAHKAGALFGYSLDNLAGFGGIAAALAFMVVLFFPLILLVLERREGVPEDRGAAAFFALAVVLYVALPMTIAWPIEHWYIYPRLASLVLLAGLILPRALFHGRHALVLAPGVLAALVIDVAVAHQFASFGERARPFLTIIEAVEPDRALLTLTLDDRDPAVRLGAYNQFHAYVVAHRGGYDPYLFDNPSLPVFHRAEWRRPHPPWNRPGDFSLRFHAPHYDYLLVQGLDQDPVREGPLASGAIVRRVVEAGRWRLYRVVRAPADASPAP